MTYNHDCVHGSYDTCINFDFRIDEIMKCFSTDNAVTVLNNYETLWKGSGSGIQSGIWKDTVIQGITNDGLTEKYGVYSQERIMR